MSRRSSRSMTFSSAATSAIVRMSSSVVYGPFFRPLPGRRTLATPIRSFEKARSGGKLVSQYTAPARRSAARSVCCTA